MGNGWHEWPLVLFTVLGQCVVGALIVSGLGWLAMKDDAAARQRLVRSMFFLWLVMGLGFLASIMHLGSPMRAFNSLNRIGASGSCAMKVSTSISSAWKAVLLALDNSVVSGNDGIVDRDVENSIRNLCAIAGRAMQHTDRQIIEIMAHKRY